MLYYSNYPSSNVILFKLPNLFIFSSNDLIAKNLNVRFFSVLIGCNDVLTKHNFGIMSYSLKISEQLKSSWVHYQPIPDEKLLTSIVLVYLLD